MLSPSRPRPRPPPPPPPVLPPSHLLVPLAPAPDLAPLRFCVATPRLHVAGYQMYAVERWLVERSPTPVLLVYTGDPAHSVDVAALSPAPDLAPHDAQLEWDRALQLLRRDGARPKQTPDGVLMATSLAHFRSDYTIVLVPDGDFAAVREQLHANINLLRMGCAGRSALTLEEPSDATKARFAATYHFPDPIAGPDPKPRSVSRSASTHHAVVPAAAPAAAPASRLFTRTVLELIRLVQAGLALFGPPPPADGLLCDATVDAIRCWLVAVGKPCLGLEPMERTADPAFVAGLLSLVLAVRNKLAAIGYAQLVPKDPFLHPHLFSSALAAYVHATSSPTIPHPPHPFISPPPPVLTHHLIAAIFHAYDSKSRHTPDAGHARVRRALRDKLRAGVVDAPSDRDRDSPAAAGSSAPEDKDAPSDPLDVPTSGGQILSGIGSFASGLGLGPPPGTSGGPAGAAAVLGGTCDLAALVRGLYPKDPWGGRHPRKRARDAGGGDKDRDKDKDGGVAVSVKALWSGQVDAVIKLREWDAEKVRMALRGTSPRRKSTNKGEDRWALSDGDVDDTPRGGSGGVKSETEEESDSVMQQGSFRGMWGERMQKKLGSWAGLSKRRGNMSLDLSTPASRPALDALATARPDMARGQSMPLSPLLPPMVFSGGNDADQDDDDLLSSGQVSPVDNLRPSPFTLLHDGRSLESTSLITSGTTADKDYERKVSAFNQKRPFGARVPQHRISSWADPFSARELLDEDGEGGGVTARRPRARRGTIGSASVLSEVVSEEEEKEKEEKGLFRRRETFGPTRRRSFHDLASLRGMRPIPVEHMRVDVELSAQVLILTRRSHHLQNVIACLHVLTSSLSHTSSLLRSDYTTHLPVLSALDERLHVIASIDAENARADKTAQATHTLRYEAEQFRVPDLWHIAAPSRQKVLALRERAFGTGGRRLAPGVHGAHGRFNRLQWTLDGRERLVDYLGRTESEAEEEQPGEEFLGVQDEEDEEDAVQHPGIKPMWLLRFFTSWGAKWGALAPALAQPAEDIDKEMDKDTEAPEGVLKTKGKKRRHNAANGKDKKLTFDLSPEAKDGASS
ncbi:hypothetical protein H0H87_009069 [Tephrocybe sp. NHM501043]|nr:hypothetical protein H0H87_009069 [Tephrocybe sp. NHM501043]